MVKYTAQPQNPTKSCKAKGADLRVSFKVIIVVYFVHILLSIFDWMFDTSLLKYLFIIFISKYWWILVSHQIIFYDDQNKAQLHKYHLLLNGKFCVHTSMFLCIFITLTATCTLGGTLQTVIETVDLLAWRLMCWVLIFTLNASPSDSVVSVQNTFETAAVLRKMTLTRAKAFLENVLKKKECVPFRRFTGGIGRCAQVIVRLNSGHIW